MFSLKKKMGNGMCAKFLKAVSTGGFLVATLTTTFGDNTLAFEIDNDDSAYYHLYDQLSCNNSPDPTLIFLYLNKNKLINFNNIITFDSISCFEIVDNLIIDDLKIKYVCGYVSDSIYYDIFPKLYSRGPGTSPGQHITVGIEGTKEMVSQVMNPSAISDIFPYKRDNWKFDAHIYDGEYLELPITERITTDAASVITEVSCSREPR